MHYYSFNVADYRKDTSHLNLLEHGIYRSLLDSYFLNEFALCSDDDHLMRKHCVRTDIEQKAYKNVINDFFKEVDGFYFNDGAEKVLSKLFEKSAKARAAAEKRWAKAGVIHKGNDAIAGISNEESMQTHIECMHDESEFNADGMLPINPSPNNLKSVSPSALADGSAKQANKKTPIPYKNIKELWNKYAPNLKGCKELTPKRKNAIKKLWNYKSDDNNHPYRDGDFYRRWFAFCNNDLWYQGNDPQQADNNWKADLEFCLKIDNIIKKMEG